MGAIDTIVAFNAAINAKQWDQVASHLTDDFTFAGASPQPMGKATYIAAQQAWAVAAPDWNIALDNLREEGATVVGSLRITGTHTGALSLPGQPSIPATGRHFDSASSSSATMRGNQIAAITLTPTPPGILEQLGVPTN